MSLINEMLRDLEQRRQKNVGTLPAGIHPAVGKRSQFKQKKYVFLSLSAILVALIALGLFYATGKPVGKTTQPDSLRHQTAGSPVVAPLQHPLKAAAVSKPVETRQATPAAAGSNSDPGITGHLTRSELLNLDISEARDHVSINLTFSGLPGYELVEKPDAPCQLILNFDKLQTAKNLTIPQQRGFLQQLHLRPRGPGLQLLADFADRPRIQTVQVVQHSPTTYQLQLLIGPIDPPAAQIPALKTQTEQLSAEGTEKKRESVASTPVTRSKKNNRTNPAEEFFQQGLELRRQGDLAEAVEQLSRALTTDPQLLPARVQLAEVFEQQQQPVQAETILLQGLQLAPGHPQLRKILARLLMKQQRHADAVVLLKNPPQPSFAQDLEYHALLAALYQEVGHYTEAGNLYQQLLVLRPNQAIWWFGLALSLDQSDHQNQARQAFSRALQLPGLPPEVRDYIQARLASP